MPHRSPRRPTAIGKLLVVGTPIGNLGDFSPRARGALEAATVVAAEDTRTARKLLAAFGIGARVVSFHAHSRPERRRMLLEHLATGDVALVSEAGMPGLSDPGPSLVGDALDEGFPVVAIPGPSAITAALSVSGLPADSFVFLGFLPRLARERRRMLAEAAHETRTLVAFETPHRLRAALDDVAGALGGDRTIVVAREITKLHEETWRGTVQQAAQEWSRREPRGEFTLVIAGAAPALPERWDDARARAELDTLARQGVAPRDAARRLSSQSGRPARDLYRLWDHER